MVSGILPDGVSLVVHQFHDATGTRPARSGITLANHRQHQPNWLDQAGGPSARVTFSVRATPDFEVKLIEIVSPG